MSQFPQSFSQRNQLRKCIVEPEITITNSAPQKLREAVVSIAITSGLSVKELRGLICKVLMRLPDIESNWGYENIMMEISSLIRDANWYQIYDIVEKISASSNCNVDHFKNNINQFFRTHGIGWQLVDGFVELRGTEPFEYVMNEAYNSLNNKNPTVKNELHEAIQDISRRPEPDNTGAIHHSMAALECFLRDVCGSNDTLGKILQKYVNIIPHPLPTAIEKLWGYASENGRHLKEGKEANFAEAQLTVGICASIITYLQSINDN